MCHLLRATDHTCVLRVFGFGARTSVTERAHALVGRSAYVAREAMPIFGMGNAQFLACAAAAGPKPDGYGKGFSPRSGANERYARAHGTDRCAAKRGAAAGDGRHGYTRVSPREVPAAASTHRSNVFRR